MSAGSKIEWTDHTFNPWWGCAKVSPGCNHCYAEGVADRWGHDVWGVKADRRFFGDKHWAEPEKWNRQAQQAGVRARVFSGSMCDVFEDRADLDEHRARLTDLIDRTPNLDWLLLTKRPENVKRLALWGDSWPTNVWLGTSVEDQRRADERIPHLLDVPAKVRFLSCEPLLGPVDLSKWLCTCGHADDFGVDHDDDCPWSRRLPHLSWVIVGGESGAGARPMHPRWARSLRDECVQAGVPFFFKQWGEWVPYSCVPDGVTFEGREETLSGQEYCIRVGKKAAGRQLDGRTWDEYPVTEAVPA